MLIEANMIILDIVEKYPQTDPVFREYDEPTGKCVLCNHLFDTVEAFAKEYQLDEAEMLRKLNERVE